MNNEQPYEKDKLIDAIGFSKENRGFLTAIEMILIHQHINLNKPLKQSIKDKINKILQLIEQLEWERPITRYNSECQIEKLNKKTGKWEIVK